MNHGQAEIATVVLGEDELAAWRRARRRQLRDMQADAHVTRIADDRLVGEIEPQRLPGANAGRAILPPRAARDQEATQTDGRRLGMRVVPFSRT